MIDTSRAAFVERRNGHAVIEPIDNQTPVDLIEPEFESSSMDRAAILGAVLRWCFKVKQKRSAFNRFAVLCYVLKPEIFSGASQAGAAKQLGITRSGVSKIVVLIQDELKIFSRSSRSPQVRERYLARAYAVHRRRKKSLPLRTEGQGIESLSTADATPIPLPVSTTAGGQP